MGSRSTKFLFRAPRYTLNPSDDSFIRFAHEHDSGHTYTTRFINISQSGLVFVTSSDNAPFVSEIIKIEIPVQNNEHIAWWAKVVRVEEYAPHKWYMKESHFQDENQAMTNVQVAVTFHKLHPQHEKLIREALDQKFEALNKAQRREHIQQISLLIASHFWKVLIYSLCILATGWFLYYFSRPDPNYDPKIGSPWGQRFPSVLLSPEKPTDINSSDDKPTE
ncbi:MAG: hypothetical protein ABL927_10840 [Bdellovibrionales bacterium]